MNEREIIIQEIKDIQEEYGDLRHIISFMAGSKTVEELSPTSLVGLYRVLLCHIYQ